MKKLLAVASIIIAICLGIAEQRNILSSAPAPQAASFYDSADKILASAFANKRSNIQVEGTGVVVKVLPDDSQGSRHQRLLLKLASGQTILIAHNIDLAPRIKDVKVGDDVSFNGEYEWNEKGGVIHWTHHDPRGTDTPGWLKHAGLKYQ